MARWVGAPRVQALLNRLIGAVRAADPGSLVTYAAYPSTEYIYSGAGLNVDVVSFNVYLEVRLAGAAGAAWLQLQLAGRRARARRAAGRPARRSRLRTHQHALRPLYPRNAAQDVKSFEDYLPRLQNMAGHRPLLISEMGLDTARNNNTEQAALLAAQLPAAFAAGAAGTFVFSWTDEWHRGGKDVEDWDFGLVTRARRPKPALAAVAAAYAAAPFNASAPWPSITVAVATYNNEATLWGTCRALSQVRAAAAVAAGVGAAC